MKRDQFEYTIPDEYFPGYKVVEHYKCWVFYIVSPEHVITLTMVGFNPKMPMISPYFYAKLVVECEEAAKVHYNDTYDPELHGSEEKFVL